MKELCLLEKVSPSISEVIFFVPSKKTTIAVTVSEDLVGYFLDQEAKKENSFFYQVDLDSKKIIMEVDY